MYMYISIRMIFQDEPNNSTHGVDGRDHDGELERVSVTKNFLSSV